jgi:hypothetical protein
MTIAWRSVLILAVAVAVAVAAPASGQTGTPENGAAATAAQAAPDDDPDMDLNRSQPDFNIVNLPTTLRLPRFKSAFRVTHRFGRPLGSGDFASLAEDLFGLDSGAQIGLEYRFGLMRGLQGGIYRTSNRTIEFFTQYSVLDERNHPVGLGVVATVDGTNNFRDSYSPAIGVVVSKELGDRGAVYFEPMWVNNSNPEPSELTDDDQSTVMLGLGARLRILSTVYLVGEVIPRTGFTPGVTYGSFAIEKRAGGHTFQLNFSNGLGSTMAQLARGGTASDDWYLGFNISRKFF